MSEIENFSESSQEHVNEHAHHHAEHEPKERWILFVALTTAIIAVLAAVTGLLASDHADEAMLSQIKSSDQWAFYQAKSIKSETITAANKILLAMGKPLSEKDTAKIHENKVEQAKIMEEAKDFKKESDVHLEKHKILAQGVTLFQVAISIGAIAIVTKRKGLWYGSMGFAAVGIFFLIQGLL